MEDEEGEGVEENWTEEQLQLLSFPFCFEGPCWWSSSRLGSEF